MYHYQYEFTEADVFVEAGATPPPPPPSPPPPLSTHDFVIYSLFLDF
jgi:hypothetical protein